MLKIKYKEKEYVYDKKSVSIYSETYWKIKKLAAMDRRTVPDFMEMMVDSLYEDTFPNENTNH